jgi:hypothetical protein
MAGAFWTAAAVAVTFEALRRQRPRGPWALGLALLTGFASPLWSWASRSDSIRSPGGAARRSHAVARLAPRRRSTRARLRLRRRGCVSLGPRLFARLGGPARDAPLCPIQIVDEPGRRFSRPRESGPRFLCLWGLRAMAGPPFLPQLADFAPAAFAAYLVAPGRSLVAFAPVAGLAAAALIRREQPRWLVRGGGTVVLVAVLQIACLPDPWGPQSFGPALLAPLVPLFAAMASGVPSKGLRWGALIALPIFFAHGAVVFAGSGWDSRPSAGGSSRRGLGHDRLAVFGPREKPASPRPHPAEPSRI